MPFCFVSLRMRIRFLSRENTDHTAEGRAAPAERRANDKTVPSFSFISVIFGRQMPFGKNVLWWFVQVLVLVTCTERRPDVQRVMDKHSMVLCKVCDSFFHEFGKEWLCAQVPILNAKQAKHSVPARDSTIVDSSLDMVEAMKVMIELSFPCVPGRVDPVLESVIERVSSLRGQVVPWRKAARAFLRSASREVAPVTRDLQQLVSDFARPINGHVNFGLIECMVRVCEWPHKNLVDVLLGGFQVLGTIPWTGVNRPVVEPAPESICRESNAKSFDDAVSHLSQRARAAASDPKAMKDFETIWDMAIGECERELCVGPKKRAAVEKMFEDAPYGPRCIPAFAVWQKGKCRRIDDALRSGHNALICMLETIVCETADLPARIAAAFARHIGLENLRLRLGTDDIASAYRILVSAQPQYTIAALWCPPSRGEAGVYYFVLRGFNFGLKCAPLHLATLMGPLIDFARKFGLVPCGSFYDDVASVDVDEGLASAQATLTFLFSLLGFPFAPAKHERQRRANPFLGVVTDFAYAASGFVILRVKEKRRRRLLEELKEVRKSGRLTPAHAARLRGKLYFTTCTAYFGVGRPALHAFSAGQYEKRRRSQSFALNNELRNSIDFFIALLQKLPPHKEPLLPDDKKPVYIWSDAMWEALQDDAGDLVCVVDPDTEEVFYLGREVIAFLCFDPQSGVWHTSSMDVGLDVIRKLVPGKKTYIGQLEALAAACVLETLPSHVLKGRAAIFWIDNLAAKFGLQKGYSRVEDSGRIVNAFKIKQASLSLRAWFEYVPSEQNIADLPSRSAFERMLEVIDVVSGGEWTIFEYSMVLPKFESWLAPLDSLSCRKRNRSGSRGRKRPRKSSSALAASEVSTSS